jgi:hypothetical protein
MRRRAPTPHLVLLIARQFGASAAESGAAQGGLQLTRPHLLQHCQHCYLASVLRILDVYSYKITCVYIIFWEFQGAALPLWSVIDVLQPEANTVAISMTRSEQYFVALDEIMSHFS